MLAYLAKVELTYDEKTNEIVAPTFRQDIHYVADVAEEVARFSDMIRFRLLCLQVKLQQVSFRLNFVLKQWHVILRNIVVSLKE